MMNSRRRMLVVFFCNLVLSAQAYWWDTKMGTDIDFPYSTSCDRNTDCFNCTLSKCTWSDGLCYGSPGTLTLKWFQRNA